jgi:hypothetical protein
VSLRRATRSKSVFARSPQQFVRDQLVTVSVLAQRRELTICKEAIQIRGFQDGTCPVELIAELLQRHPLHRLLHAATVAAQARMVIADLHPRARGRARFGGLTGYEDSAGGRTRPSGRGLAVDRSDQVGDVTLERSSDAGPCGVGGLHQVPEQIRTHVRVVGLGHRPFSVCPVVRPLSGKTTKYTMRACFGSRATELLSTIIRKYS